MELSGYRNSKIESDPRLSELILAGTENELRSIARFLVHCADEMKRMGEAYDHIHLSDFEKAFSASPHFVVVRNKGRSPSKGLE